MFVRAFLFSVSAAGLFLAPAPASAVVIIVTGQIAGTDNFGSDFMLGDTFTYSFTLDDTTVDNNASTSNAQFASGVSGFTLVRGSGNIGTWDPAVGTFAAVNNFTLNANSEGITLQVGGTGFQAVDSLPFLDVVLSFQWNPGVRDFIDTGSGQTFAQVVGTSGLDFATASVFAAEIRNNNFDTPQFSHTVSAVPEPSTYAALFGACALIGAMIYRRRR